MLLVQYLKGATSATAVVEGVQSAIRAGDLRGGDVLPSVRVLAKEIGLSPGTVAAAYRSLRERGLAETLGRSGTIVRGSRMRPMRSVVPPVGGSVVDLSTGQPDPGLLPAFADGFKAGTQLLRAADQMVLPELLEIAQRRFAQDNVQDKFTTVANGGLDAIGRTLITQLRPGDIVGVEDPGWPNMLDQVAALGLRVHPIPIDQDGPMPDGLAAALRAGARAVVVTNRAHNPTGAFLTAERAACLRDVLRPHPDILTIEDDHAAELTRVPLATIAGATSAWAFVRSMSKPYGPDLRLAFLAGDAATVNYVESHIRVTCGWVSTILQQLAVHLYTDSVATQAVASAGAEYDRRRQLLLQRLNELSIPALGATGLNVWIPVDDETATTSALLQAGWAVAPGNRFRQHSAPGIRITMAASDDTHIQHIAAVIHQSLSRSGAQSRTT